MSRQEMKEGNYNRQIPEGYKTCGCEREKVLLKALSIQDKNCAKLSDKNDKLKEENAKLKEALRKHAVHSNDCIIYNNGTIAYCDCGLSNLLQDSGE